MKKIIFLTALISSSIAFFAFKNDKHTPIFDASLVINKVDTFPNKASVSNASTLYTVNGGLKAGIGNIITNYIDTFAANATPIKDYSGAQIFVADTLYIRNINKTKWVAVLSNSSPLPFNDSIYVKPPLYVIVDSLGRRIIAIHMQDGLVSGGIVTWSGQGLIFNISPAIYVIGGVQYSSPATQDTLSPANVSNPRYDLFVVDTSNRAGHITGEAAPSPTVPQPEIGFQLSLTNGLIVNPGDTTPSNVVTTVIYDQNIEWSSGQEGGTPRVMDFNSTTNPYHLTKALYVSKYNNSQAYFYSPSSIQTSSVNTIDMWIYLTGAMSASNNIYLLLFDSATRSANYILLNSDFGFNKNDSNNYQHVVIPASAIRWLSPTFNLFELTFTGSDTSGAKGLYFDYIRLQSGIPNIPPANDYSNKADSAGVYWINDTTYIGRTWRNGIAYNVGDTIHFHTSGGAGGSVNSVTGNPSGLVDNTDPANPIVQQDASKVNISDTASMLSHYPLRSELQDTAAAIRADFPAAGAGNTNSNVGSAYRLAIPNTNNIKTLSNGWGISLDSITTNTINLVVDSAALSLKYLRIADTSAMLAPYQQKITLTTTGTSGASTLTGNTLNVPQYSGGGSYTDSLTQVGIIYSKKSWANLNDFTDVGTGATISGSDINITGGTNSFGEYLAEKDTVMYQDWQMRMRFKINGTISSTSYGIGCGINSPANVAAFVKADLSTGANAGKLLLYYPTSTLLTTINSGSPITFINGDTLEMSIKMDGLVLTASLLNLSDSSNVYSISYYYYPTSGTVESSVGNFSIYRFGGNYNINSIAVISSIRKYPTFAFIGDSKTQFYKATEKSNGYVQLLSTYLKNDPTALSSIADFAGGSETSAQSLSTVNSIIATHPKIAFMAIGSNDKRLSVSNATWFSNYKSIVSNLQNAGITVYHLLPFPESTLTFSDYVDSILITYPAANIVDTYTPLLGTSGHINSVYVSGDGVHPNDLGHQVIYRTILKTGLFDSIYTPIKAKSDWNIPVTNGGGNISTNLAIGVQNMFGNTTGSLNTAIGYSVMPSSNGTGNTAIGASALNVNTTGGSNNSIGASSLLLNTTGSNNTADGYFSLSSNVSGSNNTAIGFQALKAFTGSTVTAVGANALKANVSSANSSAFGYNAGAVLTGDFNTAIGTNSLSIATTTGQSTAVGFGSIGGANTTGNQNTAIGVYTLRNLTSGANNTAIGHNSLTNLTTGSANIGLGEFSGKYLTTGSNEIVINSLDRTNLTGDSTASPIMIHENTTPNSQKGALNTKIGIFNNLPTAYLQVPAGSSVANSAPIKMTYTSLATTNATQTSTLVTLTFAAQPLPPFIVGSTIVVAGVTPTGYNGTWTVTASTNTTVSYITTSGLTAQTVAGTIIQGQLLTTPEPGAIEFDGTHFYGTDASGTRHQLDN